CGVGALARNRDRRQKEQQEMVLVSHHGCSSSKVSAHLWILARSSPETAPGSSCGMVAFAPTPPSAFRTDRPATAASLPSNGYSSRAVPKLSCLRFGQCGSGSSV